jgi:hypothetical protein
MNRQKPVLFIIALALIGATAGVLAHAKTNQKLGLPGVKTRPLADSHNLEVLLPETVPGYTSMEVPQTAAVTNLLPRDTSYGQRFYKSDDGIPFEANVVLMGSSRASIHNPLICLTAQGWQINEASSHMETIHLDRPFSYDLPVTRLNAAREVEVNGQKVMEAGVYVHWYVDEDHYTASQAQWKIEMARDVLLKGQVDRWAYISFFSVGEPGQEDAIFDRIKKLITATVPDFQLVPQVAKSN